MPPKPPIMLPTASIKLPPFVASPDTLFAASASVARWARSMAGGAVESGSRWTFGGAGGASGGGVVVVGPALGWVDSGSRGWGVWVGWGEVVV
ncbi:MAG: hypothetical protein AAFX99_11895, partial [Myxococcota bacterium]